jgi:predicted ATP-dependent endonuclease of OLD family
MKLHIENFRKIASADLELNGLTVVIGDNNTGKSTIGKLWYSFRTC